MFKNLFNKIAKSPKCIYLVGWQVRLNGDQECENFIATQITNKETLLTLFTGMELIFDDNKLIKAFEYNYGNRMDRVLEPDEIGLAYKAYPVNRVLELVPDKNGLHQLGGEIPSDFWLPKNNCVVGFQYLGYINNQDKHFNWLPFKVHLICPIYLNFSNLFLDYTDPNSPIIINQEEIEKADTSYSDDLNQHSEIIFNEMKLSAELKNEFKEMERLGHSGIPEWIQYPTIPVCPKSGKRMRFLCQLNGGVTTKKSNIDLQNAKYGRNYEKLDFWGGGDLYVFFEPTSKVACYFIQNT